MADTAQLCAVTLVESLLKKVMPYSSIYVDVMAGAIAAILDHVLGWIPQEVEDKKELVCRRFIRECCWDLHLRKGEGRSRTGESKGSVVMQ